ncbi:VanW family protein [Aestuariimicrobium soli]|uniref:VanW family protein n=1 Tax=Aestuariimicrobium soli TaxID=2035834 RepID=UPI003EC151CB
MTSLPEDTMTTHTSAADQVGTTFELPTRLQAGAPLSERHPWLYPLAVKYHQTRRWIAWQRSSTPWAATRSDDPLPVKVKLHKSLLLRSLGESEMWLQHNKVTNLRLAAAEVNGILIRPGESFSFNKVVGNCTKGRGFVEGMRLSNGEARPGVGGGICQLANLLHWMFLHSALTVTERSEHSFDPFPDNGRVLPWGVGCSIVWNYVDLVVRNDTDTTFQLLVGVGDRYLEGELRADQQQSHSYKVFARNEQFLKKDDEYFRRNEIWRELIDRRTGNRDGEELVKRNCALVKYLPQDVAIIDLDEAPPPAGAPA